MMSVALGALGWSPDQFWRATPHAYFAHVEYLERAAEAREED